MSDSTTGGGVEDATGGRDASAAKTFNVSHDTSNITERILNHYRKSIVLRYNKLFSYCAQHLSRVSI